MPEEPIIEGYTWLTNMTPNMPFNAEGFEKRDPPYTDIEIAKHYAEELNIPVEDVLVRVAIADDSLRAVYKKIQV